MFGFKNKWFNKKNKPKVHTSKPKPQNKLDETFDEDRLFTDDAIIALVFGGFIIGSVFIVASNTLPKVEVGDIIPFPAKNTKGVIYHPPVHVGIANQAGFPTCTIDFMWVAKHSGSMMVTETLENNFYVAHWQGEPTAPTAEACSGSQDVVLSQDNLMTLSKSSSGLIEVPNATSPLDYSPVGLIIPKTNLSTN